jgi:hypothetical protein
MKSALLFLAVLGLALTGAGCGHVDLRPEGDPQRTVSGIVTMTPDLLFPEDTEVVVRVIDTAPGRPVSAIGGDSTLPDRSTLPKVERIIGEKIVRAPGAKPVAFTVEFTADDAALRRGLTIEARISWGGQLRWRSMSNHVITLSNLSRKQEVWVDAVR